MTAKQIKEQETEDAILRQAADCFIEEAKTAAFKANGRNRKEVSTDVQP